MKRLFLNKQVGQEQSLKRLFLRNQLRREELHERIIFKQLCGRDAECPFEEARKMGLVGEAVLYGAGGHGRSLFYDLGHHQFYTAPEDVLRKRDAGFLCEEMAESFGGEKDLFGDVFQCQGIIEMCVDIGQCFCHPVVFLPVMGGALRREDLIHEGDRQFPQFNG